MLCLADDFQDLRTAWPGWSSAYTYEGQARHRGRPRRVGAMALLLKDAIKPNLVQTLEGTPAFIHGGPFANIAHGNNIDRHASTPCRWPMSWSPRPASPPTWARKSSSTSSAGQAGSTRTARSSLVATIRALKMHGGAGKDGLAEQNVEALDKGFSNLDKHIENMQALRRPAGGGPQSFPRHDAEELALR